MLKISDFGWGYIFSNGSGEDKQTDLYRFYDLSSSIHKVSFKNTSMSLGLVALEKLFIQMQSDAMLLKGDHNHS